MQAVAWGDHQQNGCRLAIKTAKTIRRRRQSPTDPWSEWERRATTRNRSPNTTSSTPAMRSHGAFG